MDGVLGAPSSWWPGPSHDQSPPRADRVSAAPGFPAPATDGPPPDAPGPWRRHVLFPLMNLLAQGLTPEKLALSLAVGLTFGLFPVVGATTLLSLAAGFALRLNHAAVQLVNYLAYPLQLPLILAFVRLGEALVSAPPMPFAPTTLVAQLRADPALFLERFGLTGLHGILGWSVVAPAILAAVYFATLPLLRRLDAALRQRGSRPLDRAVAETR
jgi:uncharacterized protein (DUF2062 family)